MKHKYVILTDDQERLAETKAAMSTFPTFSYVGTASNYEAGLDLILELSPQIVFLEVDPANPESKLSLHLINELHRYLEIIPEIVITAKAEDMALPALKHGVLDYIVWPFSSLDFRKCLLRYEKGAPASAGSVQIPEKELLEKAVVSSHELSENQKSENPDNNSSENPLVLCVKSYGDYRFIEANQILYLKADNNSTDIHLKNGEFVTAFKTLKHFEASLPLPFIRVHNSYILNTTFLSRINLGNFSCYLKDSTEKIPFSKSYKENVESFIDKISQSNYLEI